MLIILLLAIYHIKANTIQSQATIKEHHSDEDFFSIEFLITSNEKINTIEIQLNQLKCLQTAAITPILNINQISSPYNFELDFENNIINVSLDIENKVYSQLIVQFEITQFYYPTFNQEQSYGVRVDNQNLITFFVTRKLKMIASLYISSQSSTTQEYSDLNFEFINPYKNHPYDVILVRFVSIYPFDISFSSCLGIQNIGKNLKCWKQNNIVYLQQNSDDFVEKTNQELIKFKLKDFLNPYYVGITTIEVLIQPIQFVDTPIASSFFDFNYQIQKQKNKEINLTQQIVYINFVSKINLVINTQKFNQYLQLEIFIPNKSSNQLIFKSDDNNMQVEALSSFIKDIQLLKLTINQPQTNYDIKLQIENYQNPTIPSQEKCFYFLTEIFDSGDDPLQIQYGKGLLNFIPNNINLIQIITTSNYITQSAKTTIIFGIDIIVSKDSLLHLQFHEKLNTSKISSSNQIISENTITLFGRFDEQRSEYTIEFENIINPIMPSKFSYVDLQIIYLNEVIASNQNQIEIEFIPEIIKMSNLNLDYLISNSYTTFKLDINFGIQHPYFTNIEFQFDTSNINFNSIIKQIQCFLDTLSYICQIHQNKLTIFGVQLIKSSLLLEIFNFPYPRSLQPLIIQSVRQFNNSNILLQTDQTYQIQPIYNREFTTFYIQIQSEIQKQQSIPFNIIIIPSQDIWINEFLVFQFDNQLEVENDATCQINTDLINIQCEFSEGQIKIMILSGSLIHGMSYSILINQMKIIQDYVNLKISAFTQNNYLQQQSLFTYINKKQSQSSEFPEFTFDPIESQYFAESNYNLFFENKINIPANGYLQLSAKQLSINFLSSEIIQVFGNEIISSSKIVKQNQKFSLQLYFEKEVYGGMHLFRMQNINNPTYAQRQDYYTFQLESYDQYNNLLEYKEYDLYFIFICPQLNCLICNQQEFCDKCEANQILYQGQCLKECPQNTVFINQQCQRCNAGSSCLSCSNIDTVLCTKCSDGYDLINGFCIWTITQNSTQNQNTSNSNNNNNNNSNANNQDQQIQKNQNLKQQRLFDIHIFAIIVLSFAILSILRNIFRKQTDFFNAILAFSGISDFSQQFILFTIILVNYSTSQSIFSLTLCFVSIIQQLYAYQLIKLPLQVDFAYQRIQEIRFAKILKFLTLFIDWKIIFIHKSSITDSQLFFIHFQNEIKLQKLIKFLFLVKILVNLANLGMLGIILISQDQIAQLIYESTIYNLVMILIQLNKIYQIKLILENDNHNDAINSVVFLTNELNQDNENQDQNKITAKVTPESMIIQQN